MAHAPHPALARPIRWSKFLSEFRVVWDRAGLDVYYAVFCDEELARLHSCRNSRRYAFVEFGSRGAGFYFAPQTLYLPKVNRLALICHEIGHVLAPGTERDADRASWEVLGVRIGYDRRWRGKGLQTVVEIRR